jgi:hypothetical protein
MGGRFGKALPNEIMLDNELEGFGVFELVGANEMDVLDDLAE